jgi:hypothetical protein
VVSAIGLEGSVRDRDTQMAALTAIVIRCTRAIGAKLGHGVVFHEAGLFAELAALGAEKGVLPPELAVDVTIPPDDGDRRSLLTHGMKRYGREDIWVTYTEDERDALDLVTSLVRWLVDDLDKHLPTGDLVGRTPEEKLRIRRVPDPSGAGTQLIRLDLP